ncbi:hypothetical protein [Longimicrobium sp.]|uniref:hypothetical protein n=1 Tax=Longimicrobium sp. TaxID=2029185 RepID=UPI002E369488|nr:hypothetical protein [Longimicrobium sp.]HEX6039131.1 hypothetical protein [Longimicrobium sp.]
MGYVPLDEIAPRVQVPLGTLKKWSRAEAWGRLRKAHAELERKSAEVALALAERARDSGDPQQAFAMSTAAMVSLKHAPPAALPTAREMAKRLVRVLEGHPVLGPAVRRHRKEVIDLVAAEADRMGEAVG